jgi:LPXTG-site transpeptidase (sortase) family protein
LKLAVCNDLTCTAPTLTTVDSTGGWYTSLVLSGSGNPVISYYDATNGDLKVAVCANATCTTSTITTVDSTGFVGVNPSLALNASGHPVISYDNIIPAGAGGTLKVAICGNTTCTAQTTTVDIGTGLDGSLALNASGFPVISFLGGPNRDLRLAVLTPPSVIAHTLQASYTSGPSSFTVTFSENVNNSGSGSSPNDTANPANYRIINKGADGVLNTASCATPLGGDDAQIIPSSVTYVPNTATVNLGNALPNGSYRVFVCGTTSIVSNGVPIPLNFGTDFTFDFVVGTTAPQPSTTASSLPDTGFAPNRITSLAPQPANLAYAKLSDIWLEIPSLNVKTNIVGVPKTNSRWEVAWLGNDVGWLNRTAFPSWEGNSVLTAHVYDANGRPGPFARIKDLTYGDRIILHLYGEQYIFEVRSTHLSRPSAAGFAFQHLEDHSFLTLITCEGYNERTDSYGYRRVVRAVLVELK